MLRNKLENLTRYLALKMKKFRLVKLQRSKCKGNEILSRILF